MTTLQKTVEGDHLKIVTRFPHVYIMPNRLGWAAIVGSSNVDWQDGEAKLNDAECSKHAYKDRDEPAHNEADAEAHHALRPCQRAVLVQLRKERVRLLLRRHGRNESRTQ
jgi:hypothetical protein